MSARIQASFASAWLLTAAGCASLPRAVHDKPAATESVSILPVGKLEETHGEQIARRAHELLGVLYRFGGADRQGFDCSGLVRYVFQQQGQYVPRTAAAQMQFVRPIPLAALQPGDLVFYLSSALRGAPVDHVGIYVGEGVMVHAPRTGRAVEARRLDDAWYVQRFRGAGRVPEVP